MATVRNDLKLCIMQCVTNTGIRLMNGRLVNPNVEIELNKFERYELVRKSGYVLYEILPDGTWLQLNLENYNTVNVPVSDPDEDGSNSNNTVQNVVPETEAVTVVSSAESDGGDYTRSVYADESGAKSEELLSVSNLTDSTSTKNQYQSKKNKNKGPKSQATVIADEASKNEAADQSSEE